MWLKAGFIVLLLVLAALAGIVLRWQQQKSDVAQKPTTNGLPTIVNDLERLRDSGDQAAFNAKLEQALDDANLDAQTRYLVYIEEGHNAMQQQEFEAAVVAYTKALDAKQDKQAAALLGDAYVGLGDSAKAIEFYTKAMTLIPADYPRAGALKAEYQDKIDALEAGASQ